MVFCRTAVSTLFQYHITIMNNTTINSIKEKKMELLNTFEEHGVELTSDELVKLLLPGFVNQTQDLKSACSEAPGYINIIDGEITTDTEKEALGLTDRDIFNTNLRVHVFASCVCFNVATLTITVIRNKSGFSGGKYSILVLNKDQFDSINSF